MALAFFASFKSAPRDLASSKKAKHSWSREGIKTEKPDRIKIEEKSGQADDVPILTGLVLSDWRSVLWKAASVTIRNDPVLAT